MGMKQRVLIFATAYFPLVGGAEVALKEVTDRIPDIEFDLICARLRSGLSSTEKIGNVTVHRVGFGHPIDKYLLPILGPLRAFSIYHTPYPRPPRKPKSARRCGQAIPHTLPIWSLMASYGGFASLVYTWFRPHTKLLLTIQEGDPLEHYAKRAGRLGFLHRAIFKRADAVQAISRFLATWAVEMGFKGEPAVIPNGVDVERFGSRKSGFESRESEVGSRKSEVGSRELIRSSFGFSDEDIVLVTVSRLSLKNAVDDLIRSLVDLPDRYKVLIAGDGEDEEMLRSLVSELRLESRVVFAGKKTHDELPDILRSSDVFVRASLSEGLGNSFLEAMCAGIPIVGTPVGGIPDFLVDGETGVFCEPRNPKSIASAVRRIQEESGLRERLIANGEHLVCEQYDWNGIAKKMDHLLRSVGSFSK
jgi:glycosyltransferase involved in cell wall biosynthesis